MVFIPHTPDEKQSMLDALGLQTEDQLFHMIPAQLQNPAIEFPPALTELEISEVMNDAAANNPASQCVSFLGGGAYAHFIPQAVSAIISRGDFSTAYTPYQPEVSQGTLQAIFEFQTMISRLTGMDACNAGVYDGASALAEGALMACRAVRKDVVLVSSSVNPHYRRVLQTYLDGPGIEVIEVPAADGATDVNALKEALSDKVAAFFVQYPNYYGVVEPLEDIAAALQDSKALLGVSANPHALGVLKTPGALGADIVTGDLQPLGISLSYGGPYAGYVACTEKYIRQLPGRLVGQTKDEDGKTGYVLTLQTREQHIRRAKATSNICTNQALCALAATVYLALMGPKGLRDAATLSVKKAHALQQALCEIEGVSLEYSQPFFHEFALRLPVPARQFIEAAKQRGLLPGIAIQDDAKLLLVCATELTKTSDIDLYKTILTEALQPTVA
ncbi:MAG: aminomethyl-transferring glycine dehydrogenase subunit GcvPA [Candidatus Hinthialibacter antarcticus]|nr:aminomethyl-transferring glycine dehydrogenase subunit GcvPA [Candidatus Hinthialibacter antarcticus]